ncbi:MAG TPA: cell division protein SepF [Erysipelothrix sp.]|nr:cell division protein SepF [Erysipelothrix sp.]
MALSDKWRNFISPIDEEAELELTEEEAKSLSDYEQPSNKSFSKVQADAKMVLFEPRTFEESEEVARHLKEKRAAVVNLHRLPPNFAQRTIDFLTGVVFAIDGSIQKIGHNVILCTPRTINVAGEISLEAAEKL